MQINGLFEKTTLIRMIDGAQKPVDSVRIGEPCYSEESDIRYYSWQGSLRDSAIAHQWNGLDLYRRAADSDERRLEGGCQCKAWRFRGLSRKMGEGLH